MPNQERDQNVLSFMMQLVQQKYGDEVEVDFLTNECVRLYDGFGDALVDFFEPMLTNDQKKQFDKIIDGGADQNGVLEFLMSSIPSLDQKIQQVLAMYRNQYLQPQQ